MQRNWMASEINIPAVNKKSSRASTVMYHFAWAVPKGLRCEQEHGAHCRCVSGETDAAFLLDL
jgi:hypothetical protein